MNDKRHKRLVLLLYAVSIAALIFIFSLGIWAFMDNKNEIKQLRESVRRIEEKSPATPINGLNGKDGITPIKNVDYFDGIDGKNGKDSLSSHTETTIIKETPVNGKDGKDGKDGKPGLTPEIYIDRESCLFMTRYGSDDSWEIQAQLPKPCEVQ